MLFRSGVGEAVENTVAVAAVVPTNGYIRYGRDELISIHHNTPPDLIVDIVDSLPSIVCSWRLRTRAHSRANSVVEQQLPSPSQAEVTIASFVEVVPVVKKASGLGGLGDSKWSSSEKATSTAPEPHAKKYAGTGAENGTVHGEVVKIRKLGGLADSKYASPEKKSLENPAPVSSRGAGQSTPSRPRPTPRQSPAPGGSNGVNAERRRTRVVDENISPFPSRRRKRGGFGMDGGDDESFSLPRRRSWSKSPPKSPSRSEKNVDDEVQGAAGDTFVAPAVVSTARAPLAERTNLHQIGRASCRERVF